MTKLAANPNYGRPSPTKLRQRLNSWERWRNGMRLLRSIKQEIEAKNPQPAE